MKQLGVLSLCLMFGFGDLWAQPRAAVFTNAADIHRLSRDEAEQDYTVRLCGVVTYSDPHWNVLFIRDQSAGIYVAIAEGAYPTNNELVEITGSTGEGSFLPVVRKASWRHLGNGTAPVPRRMEKFDHFTGDVDCEYSELIGVVRQVSFTSDNDHLQIDVAGTGWRSRAFLALSSNAGLGNWARLIDAKVTIIGVCGVDYDDVPGRLLLKTFIPSAECIRLEEPGPAEPFASRLVPQEEVRAFSPTDIPVHRIHVRGVATSVQRSGEMTLQDGNNAVRVLGNGTNGVQVGDSIELAGFVAGGGFSPTFEDVLIRPSQKSRPVEAAVVAPAATVLWGDYDARLVQVTGLYQGQKVSTTNHTLALLQDGILFGVSLQTLTPESSWANLKPGDRLRVNGVCTIQTAPNGTPQSFGLVLRSRDDVVVLPALRMFPARQVLAVLIAGSAAWGLVLLWGVALRRKVAEQTKKLAQSLSLLTAAIESTTDGVLVVDLKGGITTCNKIFTKMWGLPDELLGEGQDRPLLEFAAAQLKDPEQFLRKVRQLYDSPDAESFDTIECKDGRIFERYSQPQRLGMRCVGRVWCFRDVTARKQAELRLEEVHQQLLEASRRAGRAEVATSVLHNVGNVLNSVNVSAAMITERLRKSRAENLAQAAHLIESRMDNLEAFFKQDPRGEKLRSYLKNLSATLIGDNDGIRAEVDSLRQNVEHIKTIVAMQQSYARTGGAREWLDPKDLMEQAIQISSSVYQSDEIQLLRDYKAVGPILLDRHKVLQVLINLLSNARHALEKTPRSDRRVTVSIFPQRSELICLRVSDNGMGIQAENLNRIFKQGFTTRAEGHGFGLHSSADAAKEMNGALLAQSEGTGKGAVFTLEIPASPSLDA